MIFFYFQHKKDAAVKIRHKLHRLSSSLWTHQLYNTMNELEREQRTCSSCGNSFTNSESQNLHTFNHSADKLFECETCEELFRDKKLSTDILIHTGGKTCMCRNCIKSVLQKSHLSTHTHNHSGEIKHDCGICGKLFTNILHLEEHMVSHTEAKPFKCGIGERALECEQQVTDHNGLYYWIKTV